MGSLAVRVSRTADRDLNLKETPAVSWLRNLRVGVRLGATIALTVIAMTAIGATVLWSDHSRQTHIDEAIALSTVSDQVRELRYYNVDVQDLQALILSKAYAGDPKAASEGGFFNDVLAGVHTDVDGVIAGIDTSELSADEQVLP